MLESTDEPITMIVHDDPWAGKVALKARRRHPDRLRLIYRIGNLKPEGVMRLSRKKLAHLMASVAARWRDRLMGEADGVIFNSEEMRRYLLEDRGCRPSRDVVIPGLVDADRIRQDLASPDEQDVLPLRESMKRDCHWIVYAGDVSRGRNIEFLFEMLEHATGQMPAIGLLVLGNYPDPEYRDHLVASAHDRLPQVEVRFAGPLPPKSYHQALGLADVAVNPFPPVGDHLTNSPVKCVDYQAVGIPMVATRIPDQQAVLEATGLGTVCAYDPEAFATACVQWLQRDDVNGAGAQDWISDNRDLAVGVESIQSLCVAVWGNTP